jgi:hypothetical protein
MQGGIDVSLYDDLLSRPLVPVPTAVYVHLSRGMPFEMGMLAQTELPPPSFTCMAAVQLDGRLLPLQQRVQFQLRYPNQSTVHYAMTGWHGLSVLTRNRQLQGYRWLRLKQLQQAAPGDNEGNVSTLPGLLVIAITSKTAAQGAASNAQGVRQRAAEQVCVSAGVGSSDGSAVLGYVRLGPVMMLVQIQLHTTSHQNLHLPRYLT